MRVEPLEPPRKTQVSLGSGLGIQGARDGNQVRAQLLVVQYCADEQQQRARGFQRVERQAIGWSLKAEWLFGGLIAATGAGLMAYTAANPPDPTVTVKSQRTAYLQAGAVLAVGVGLLAAATWQQLGLGVHETPLGEKVLTKRGSEYTCGQAPATGGRARLTLADGHQIEGDADASGVALLPLPDDLELRMQTEGSRRATLEALGDPRAQVRIGL